MTKQHLTLSESGSIEEIQRLYNQILGEFAGKHGYIDELDVDSYTEFAGLCPLITGTVSSDLVTYGEIFNILDRILLSILNDGVNCGECGDGAFEDESGEVGLTHCEIHYSGITEFNGVQVSMGCTDWLILEVLSPLIRE